MARHEKIVDLYWSDEGDFVLGDNNDLRDTQNDAYRGLIQRVLTRIKSRKGDWGLQESIGAGVTAVVGTPNTAETGARLKFLIQNELMVDDLLRPGEFIVDVFPASKSIIAVAVVITPPRSGSQVILTFSYDLRDNRLVQRNL